MVAHSLSTTATALILESRRGADLGQIRFLPGNRGWDDVFTRWANYAAQRIRRLPGRRRDLPALGLGRVWNELIYNSLGPRLPSPPAEGPASVTAKYAILRPTPRLALVLAAPCLVAALAGPAAAQRDLTEIPDPDPDAEQRAMKVDPQSAVNLFAADPEISKPIQMNFDSTGGLWIASSEVYPQILPGEKANDKIIVLRDTDGDGQADQRTVFADGLLIPTGVVPDGPDAAYVAESTRLLYLQDTDGDGVADKRRIVLSGFGTEDTHHLVHTLRWGPDGCLYFNQSIYIHSHIDTPFGTRHLDGGGIWRYRPNTGRLEVFCKGFVNPWGHVFDHQGESFVTDGAYFEGINYVFPDAVFVTSPGATRWLKGLNPGSPKHCGLEILSGTHIPPSWAGDFVTNDFRSHRVCRFTVKPGGSGYLGRQQPEIITTSHVAFRPIDARMGPDGALYVADWYNPIIQHGEVDFRDERRDRKHGRIWRVSFPGRPLDRWPEFSGQTLEQLINQLQDPALPVRQFSRQELWNRAKQDPAGVLAAYRRWRDTEQTDIRSLEVLWINEVLGQPSIADAKVALREKGRSPEDSQRTKLRSLWRSRTDLAENSADRNELTEMVTSRTLDSDPRVRLESVVSNGQLGGVAAAENVIGAASREVDANLDFAIWQSLRTLDANHPGSILSDIDWSGKQRELAVAVSAIGTPGAAETAVKLLESGPADAAAKDALVGAVARSGDSQQLGRVVKILLEANQGGNLRKQLTPLFERTTVDGIAPAGVGELLWQVAIESDNLIEDPDKAITIARAAEAWRAARLEKWLTKMLPKSDGQLRAQIIAALGSFNLPSARQKVMKLTRDSDAAVRVAATQSLAKYRPRNAIAPLIELLGDDVTADAAVDLTVGMLKRKDLPPLIAKAITEKGLTTDRARVLLRRVRSAGGNKTLEDAIRTAGKLDSTGWKLTPELSQEILALVKSEGSAQRGEKIYRRASLQCINCHAIGTAGGLVGPNLISVGGSSQPDYILESLLDPSAKLKEGFTTLSVLTEDSEVINGIVIGKSDEMIRLRLADGKETQINVDEIVQEKPGKSLMADGALDSLSQGELVDLVTFLAALGRTPEYTVSTEALIRSFETLIYTPEANRRLNRTSTDTAASDDPTMTWRGITARVDGTLPIDELDQFKQHRQTPPTSFVRFTAELPSEGTLGIELQPDGIEAWINGKPTPVWNLKDVKLAKGEHTIVLAIDRTEVTQPFPVRLQGDAIE